MISYAELVKAIMKDTKIGGNKVRAVLTGLRRNVYKYVANGEAVDVRGFCRVIPKKHPKDGYRFRGKVYQGKQPYRIRFTPSYSFKRFKMAIGDKKQKEQD